MYHIKGSGTIEQVWTTVWDVPLSEYLKNDEEVCITSPEFRLGDSSWYMTLSIKHKRWIGLFLMRVDPGSPITIEYSLGIKTKSNDNTFTKTHVFESNDASSGKPELLELSEMNSSFDEGPYPAKVTCRIYNYPSVSIQGAPDSVCCATEKEIPVEDVDSSMLDKEADAQNVPEQMSCVIQRKVPDNVSYPEDEDLLLDAKELESLKLLINRRDYFRKVIYMQGKEFRFHQIINQARSPIFEITTIKNKTAISIWNASFKQPLLLVYSGRTEIFSPWTGLGAPDSVCYDTEKEIPDSVSCTNRTEFPDSEIEEDIFEDVDSTMLDEEDELEYLSSDMEKLLITGTDYDLTIYVQGKRFRVHRSILKARCPRFERMLLDYTIESMSGISFMDCDPNCFKQFLLFVYTGRTGKISPSKALGLYFIADKFNLQRLKKQCLSYYRFIPVAAWLYSMKKMSKWRL